MDVIYRLGEASVASVVEQIPDKPGYNTIRVTMSNLEKKGYLKHHQEGQRYVYTPVIPTEKAKRSALGHLLKTFFAESPSKAILTLLDMSSSKLSNEELNEIVGWIEQTRKREEKQ